MISLKNVSSVLRPACVWSCSASLSGSNVSSTASCAKYIGEPGGGPALGIRRICSRILSVPADIPIGLPGGQSSPPSTSTGPQSSHRLGLLGLLAVGVFARFLAFCSRSLDKSTFTVVRKTRGDSGLSGGRDGAEIERGSGVLTLRDPVAVCGLRGECLLGETITDASRRYGNMRPSPARRVWGR